MMAMYLIMQIEDDSERELMISIYIEMKPIMMHQALKIVKDQDIAEDVVQEAAIKLIKKISLIATLNKNQIASYVYKTVTTTAINYYNRYIKKEHNWVGGDEILHDIPDLSLSLEDEHINKDSFASLLEPLSAKDRDLLYYKYYFGYSDEEISQITGLKTDNVRVYIARIRNRIKKQLINEGGSYGKKFSME